MAQMKWTRPDPDYFLQNLSRPSLWTEQELRTEYTRLRDIARKRIQRLEGSEFTGLPGTYINLPKLRDLHSRKEIELELRVISRFLMGKMSTVSGRREQRRLTIEKFAEMGVTIREEDYNEFGIFMEYMRTQHGEVFDSVRALDLFEGAKARRIDTNTLLANYATFSAHWKEFIPDQDTHEAPPLDMSGWNLKSPSLDLTHWYNRYKKKK